jgi:hypothetical protein
MRVLEAELFSMREKFACKKKSNITEENAGLRGGKVAYMQ